MNRLKVLQVGLGSMGKRRIRNLIANNISVDNIRGFDTDKQKVNEVKKIYGVDSYNNFQKAIENFSPDVFIISTPPNKHKEYFLYAAKNKKHFFVEVGTSGDGYKELMMLLDNSFVAAPSCTFQYHPAVKKIKNIVDSKKIGKVLAYNYHLGQYLPDWHPWEDYRQVYFSKKETGACREMFPYELKWLNMIVNSEVKLVKGIIRKISDLDMTADDFYSAIVEYKNKVIGNLVIDVISRTPKRTLRLIGTEGILEWEWLDDLIKVYSSKNKEWINIALTRGEQQDGYVATEDMYHEEIKDFLDTIRENKNFHYTFQDDLKVLKVLESLESNNL